jgi:hypothetical protein
MFELRTMRCGENDKYIINFSREKGNVGDKNADGNIILKLNL